MRTDSSLITLTSPTVAHDSIVGLAQLVPAGVPILGIREIALRKGDTGKSLGLLVLVAGTLTVLGIVLARNALKDLSYP